MGNQLGFETAIYINEKVSHKNVKDFLNNVQEKTKINADVEFNTDKAIKAISKLSNLKSAKIEILPDGSVQSLRQVEEAMGKIATIRERINADGSREIQRVTMEVNAQKAKLESQKEYTKMVGTLSKELSKQGKLQLELANATGDAKTVVNEELKAQNKVVRSLHNKVKKHSEYNEKGQEYINIQRQITENENKLQKLKIQNSNRKQAQSYATILKSQDKEYQLRKQLIKANEQEVGLLQQKIDKEKQIQSNTQRSINGGGNTNEKMQEVVKSNREIIEQHLKIEELKHRQATIDKQSMDMFNQLLTLEKERGRLLKASYGTDGNTKNTYVSQLSEVEKQIRETESIIANSGLENSSKRLEVEKQRKGIIDSIAIKEAQTMDKLDEQERTRQKEEQLRLYKEMLATEREITKLTTQKTSISGSSDTKNQEVEITRQICDLEAKSAQYQSEINSKNLASAERMLEIETERANRSNKVALAQSKVSDASLKQAEKERKLADETANYIELSKRKLNNRLKALEGGTTGEFIDSDKLAKLKREIESLDKLDLKNAKKQVQSLGQTISEVGTDARIAKLNKTESALTKLKNTLVGLPAQYLSLQAVVSATTNGLQQASEHIKTVDSAWTNMSMTMSTLTRGDFDDLVNRSSKLAGDMGAVSTDVLAIAQTFANDTTTVTEVIDKLQASTALMNVSGMDAQGVTSAVMSIANSFRLFEDGAMDTATATEYLGDVITATSANMDYDFQAGIQQLIEGIGTAGSTMKSAGVDMEWFTGTLGNLIVATGKSGTELARSMRTITARIFQQKQTLEELGESTENLEIDMSNAEKALKELGVTIRGEATGELLSLDKILAQISQQWGGMSDASRFFIAETMAGKNQMDTFIGMLDSYHDSQKLVEKAYLAEGTLMNMNATFAESLEGKINSLKTAQNNLYSTILSSDAYKSAIDGLTGVTEAVTWLIDKVGVLPTALVPLSTAFLQLSDTGKVLRDNFTKLFSGVNNKLVGWEKESAQLEKTIEKYNRLIAKTQDAITVKEKAGKSATHLTTRLQGLNNGLKATQLQMVATAIKTTALQAVMSAGLSVAIGLVVAGIGKLAGAVQSFINNRSIEGITENISQLNNQVKEYKSSVEQLNTVQVDISSIKSAMAEIEKDETPLERKNELLKQTEELLGKHASNYESIEGTLTNENIPLEQRLALLEKIAEQETKRTHKESMDSLGKKDLLGFGKDAIGQLGDNIQSQIRDLEVSQNYLKEAEEAFTKTGKKRFVENINYYEGQIETAKGEIESLATLYTQYVSTVSTLKENATPEDMASINQWEEQLNSFKQSLENIANETGIDIKVQLDTASATQEASKMKTVVEEVAEGAHGLAEAMAGVDDKGASKSTSQLIKTLKSLKDGSEDAEQALEVLHDVFKDMPDDVDNVSDAIDYLNGKLGETEEATGMKDLNGSFLEGLEAIEEVQGLIDSFSDGLNTSELRNLFDSEMLNDYNGSLLDTESMLNHLKSKMQELQDQSYETGVAMALNNNNAWNQMTADMANSLGIQTEEFQNYVNSLGGLREVDIQNAANSADAQVQAEMSLVRQGAELYVGFVNSKGGNRQTDLQNVTEFLNSQGVAEARTIQELVVLWQNYYNAKKAEISSSIEAMAGDYGDLGNVDPKLMSQLHSLQRVNRQMGNYFNNVKTSFNGITSGLNQSAAKVNDAINKAGQSTGSKGGGGSKGSGSNKGGSGGSKSPSSSSSSSSKETEKEIEDLDLQIDKFQELEEAINRVSEALERNSYAQQMVGTKAELKGLLTEEIALMEKKQKAIGDLQAEIRKEQQALKEWGERAKLKFDGDELVGDWVTGGSIADRLKDAENWVNSASGAEKEWRKNDTLNLKENIERYYELMNKLGDVTNQYNEMTIAIRDAKKEQEKLLKEVENMADRYLKFAMKERALDNELSLNRRKQEYAVGIELIQLRERELEILKQQRDVNSGKIDELKKEKNELADLIQKSGFTIGADGTITNYDEIWKKKTDEYNKLAGLDAEDYKEKLDELEENIDRYLELVNDELPEAEEYYYDIADALKEIEEQQKEWAKQLEEVMDMLDRLHDVTNKLSKAENELALIEQKLNLAQGEDKIALLKRQEELYEAQKKLMQEQLNIQKQMRDEQQMELSNFGVEFDKDGYVSNYEDLIKKMQKQIESMPGGEARDKAIEELEELIEKIEEYDSLVRDEIPSTEQTWWEITNSIKEAQKEQLQIVQDVQESIAEAIKNRWEENTESLKKEIEKQKELLNKQWTEEDWEDEVAEAQNNLNKIQAQIDNLSKDSSLAGQLKLEQLKEEYQKQLEEMNNMLKEHEREQANQMFDDEQNKLDEDASNALTTEKLVEAVNKALSTGMVDLGDEVISLNDLMIDNIMKQESAYYALGDVMKSEMLGNLETALKLWKDIDNISNKVNHNVVNPIDSSKLRATNKDVSILENNTAPLISITMTGESLDVGEVETMVKQECNNLLTQLNQLMRG